jgi:cephalosporin-C deacetylase
MPLLFDMPWEALQTYPGRNPRPADHAAFWAAALADLAQVDARAQWEPAAFQTTYAECFDLYFIGVGGARVHAKVLRPRTAPDPQPALLKFHGYSGNAGDWTEHLSYVAAGLTVAALDCRGQGGSSQDSGGVQGTTLRGHIIRGLEGPPNQMLFRHIFLDAVQLARLVMALPGVDPTRVGATGSSQGGGLTLACAALIPGLSRIAPVYPFLSDYKRIWEMDHAKDAYLELQEYFRKFDPLHEREEQIFTQLGYIDVQHLAPRIRAEVLFAVGLMDTICPPSSQFAAYNKIRSRKSLRVYPDFGHEALPGHNDLVYQFMTEMAHRP